MAKSRPRFAPTLSRSTVASMASAAALTFAACTPDRLPPPRCGDGNIDIGEVCDDANAMIGDGCNTVCQLEPNAVCTGEPSRCRTTRCGDMIIDAPEVCDEGAATAICDSDCTLATCGDGVVNAARREECDDNNRVGGDGCSQDCVEEPDSCGNGTCDTMGAMGGPAETCTNCMVDCMPTPMCNGCPDDDMDGYFALRCGGNDCDDANRDVHPDATEVLCNRINEDCDGTTSDTRDADMDGFNCLLDCDDTSALASPANRNEICGDGVDNDCNAATTEDADADMDGFSCAVDCNDANAAIHPGGAEICNNGLNDDCDRDAMGMALAMPTRDVFDGDGDGAYCNADCNDTNMAIRPGVPDIMCSGVDEDCNPATTDGPDLDRDGASCALDCDDNDPTRSTLLRELCGDGIDNDCNPATVDTGDADSDGIDCALDCNDADPLMPTAMGECTLTEDFETCPTTWTTQGTSSSWACGMPAATFINRAAGGTNAWVTNLRGAYNVSELSYLVSPVFHFSALTSDPILSFSQIFQTESCCDEGWVEVSTDGGRTWRKLGASGRGQNWYNDAGNQWWDGTSGAAGAWRTASITLTGTAGAAAVRLRFVMSADSSGQQEGFGIDDIRIDSSVTDIALDSVAASVSECASGTTIVVNAQVANAGSVSLPTYDLSYTVDGGAPVTTTSTTALAAGAIRRVGLTIDVGTPGAHTIAVTVTTPGDELATNNSRTAMVTATAAGAPMIVAVPAAGYSEGFESSAGGWTASATSGTNSWARGTPSGTFITRAAEGSFAWVTNPAGVYNNNENSFVTSPCLDLTAFAADPVLAFQHIYETESCCDEGWIDIWTPTTGWQRLGAAGGGMSWYNDATNSWWDGTSGSAGAWQTASFALAGTAGQVVRIRHGFSSDGSVTRDGFGIDAVEIRP